LTSPALHIVSFDIPYPANYGGVIDVFYKIRALHGAGFKIHLHCFLYQREPSPELEKYCETVNYYHRNTGFLANICIKPYIVSSRMSVELINNLLHDDYPILFEGLHTCGFMADARLKGRFLVYRESNIEHHYYYHLFKVEKNPGRRLFFLAESIRLKLFQKILRNASIMLTVSQEDTKYLTTAFPENRVVWLPSFHNHDAVHIDPGHGSYALYQGKLSVPENSVAAEFLIEQVWEETFPELIIAGLDPPEWLIRLAGKRKNIRVIKNPTDAEMFTLIHEAHINIMVTFQPTGLKLKLLNALFNGRFCLVNPAMVTGTSLDKLCIMASDPASFKKQIPFLFALDFDETLIWQRESVLMTGYSNQNNCKMLQEILTLR
jgi:hypothetical protein